MLLSRTAEDLYWLGRHIERTESIARIVGEHTALLVDLPVDVESDWGALLNITGAQEPFAERYDELGEDEIVTFLLADVGNPGSLVRSVNSARESLRVTRQMVPRSAWECLNGLHRTASEQTAACTSRSHRMAVVDSVVGACQQFSGILEGTMNRDHAYRFWELGRLVERADMTTRVLDVRAGTLMDHETPAAHPPADRSPYEDVRWLGVLRCVAGQHMYHRSSSTSVEGDGVVTFLLDDEHFPRSVAHCTTRIANVLSELPRRSAPRRATTALREHLGSRPAGRPDARQLHEHLDGIQVSLGELHAAVDDSYFTVEHLAAANLRQLDHIVDLTATTG